MEITDSKEVWVVWTNTDRTEGRGYMYPLHVCESQATAIRKAKNEGVMGSNASVEKGLAVRVGNSGWLAPVKIVAASEEDKRNDAILRQMEEDKQRKLAAIERAKAAGLSDEDIEALNK